MSLSSSVAIELPTKGTGEIDWRTLGNILSANILGEVLHASYVDYKYGRRSRSFEADTSWEFFYEENDVVVFRKRFSNSPIHAWMGRCVIDLPVQEVVDYLQDHSNRKYWDKYLVETREEKRMSENDVIIYLHLEATQCLVKQHRDFIYYERIGYVDGKFVRSALSIDLPEYPKKVGLPRGQMLPGTGWVLEPYENNKTLITFCAHVDLKNLPALIINRATRRSPMCVYHIREFLTNQVYRNKHHQGSTPERSNDTFTASEIAYLNRQNFEGTDESFQVSHGYQRFVAEEQLSVRDFLRNRPSLRRYQSVPSGLSVDNTAVSKQRSHSQGSTLTRDEDEYMAESTKLSASFTVSSSTDNPVCGFHDRQDKDNRDTMHSDGYRVQEGDGTADQAVSYTDELSFQTPSQSVRQSPFLTPEASGDELSQYHSPIASPDDSDEDTEQSSTLPTASVLTPPSDSTETFLLSTIEAEN